jgi:hypothetical protein
MAGHSRSKNGVASLAYAPAIHVLSCCSSAKPWMPATSAGMTVAAFRTHARAPCNRFAASSAALTMP